MNGRFGSLLRSVILSVAVRRKTTDALRYHAGHHDRDRDHGRRHRHDHHHDRGRLHRVLLCVVQPGAERV